MGTCRFCGAGALREVATTAEWVALSAGRSDSRAAFAALVQADDALNFGGVVSCPACAFISVGRPPAAAALNAFYQAYYANADYAAKREKKISRARRRLASAGAANGRSFLDVGCNLGFAVEAARLAGFKSKGIEIDAEAVAKAGAMFSGCGFECADVKGVAARGDHFDVVWCTEVIEHVSDFRAFAVDLARLVAPGGLLFLTTPDAGHPFRPRDLLEWDEVKPPEHLQWFRASHLRMLFEPEGLKLRFPFSLKPNLRAWGQRGAIGHA